jgi:hypothetical protein
MFWSGAPELVMPTNPQARKVEIAQLRDLTFDGHNLTRAIATLTHAAARRLPAGLLPDAAWSPQLDRPAPI